MEIRFGRTAGVCKLFAREIGGPLGKGVSWKVAGFLGKNIPEKRAGAGRGIGGRRKQSWVGGFWKLRIHFVAGSRKELSWRLKKKHNLKVKNCFLNFTFI